MPRTGRPISARTRAILAGEYAEHPCNGCGVIKPFTPEYYGRQKHEVGGLRRKCRICLRDEDKRRDSSQRQMAWRRKNPGAYAKIRRRQHLRRRYGISSEHYEEMLRKQNGCCAICRKPETTRNSISGTIQSLHLDHCHTTGKVRGLLCSRCNLAVGHMKDSPELCRRMASYLEEHAGG